MAKLEILCNSTIIVSPPSVHAIRDFAIAIASSNLHFISGAGHCGAVSIDEIDNIVDANSDCDLDQQGVAVLVADMAGDGRPNHAFEGTPRCNATNTSVFAPQTVRSGILISSPVIDSGSPHTGPIFDYGTVGIPTGGSLKIAFFASNLRPGTTWAEPEFADGISAVSDVAATISVPASAALPGSVLADFGSLRHSCKGKTAV